MEMPKAWSPKFGGINLRSERYSLDNQAKALFHIQQARKMLGELPCDYTKGARYSNDRDVLSYLESGANEVEFFTNPLLMCVGALLGAAASDHWFSSEDLWEDHGYEGEDCEVEE